MIDAEENNLFGLMVQPQLEHWILPSIYTAIWRASGLRYERLQPSQKGAAAVRWSLLKVWGEPTA